MLSTILGKIKYKLFLRWIKPEMLPYITYDKKKIRGSKVSNMSHISNRENLNFGENVWISHFSYIDGYKEVKIGEGTQISNYVSIITHSSHDSLRIDPERINLDGMLSGEVEIGAFCFIGSHSVIMPGTKIGKGCIISAYSFVSGHFPDYSILRGQPAKIIGNTKERDLRLFEINPKATSTYYESFND